MEIALGEAVDVSGESYIMAKLTVAVMYMGWMVVFSACASSEEIPDPLERGTATSTNEVMPLRSSLFLPALGFTQLKRPAERATASGYDVVVDLPGSGNARFLDVATSHDFNARKGLASRALNFSGAHQFVDIHAGSDDSRVDRQSLNGRLHTYLLDASRTSFTGFTAGYTWRTLTFEQSAISAYRKEQRHTGRHEWPKLESKLTRLSFTPAPNWTFRLSRGAISGLDQLMPNDDVRRASISAIYTRNFNRAHWQTTVGWGRYTRKSRETMVGYLLESTLRFRGTHSMFGRLEQVGSDDLMRVNESLQRHLFRIKKLTLGYFQEMQPNASFGLDIGGMVSRHFIPADMTSSYGRDPISYMMFVRFKFQ